MRAPSIAHIRIAAGSDRGDRAFEIAISALALVVPVVLAGIVFLLVVDAAPALARYGGTFITDTTWNPVAEQFGAAAYIYGTVVTSVVALLLAAPAGVGCALFLAEYAPSWLRTPVAFIIELLAAIPSIIYGLWGFFVLAPAMRAAVEPFLKNVFGVVPVIGGLFGGPAIGRDLLVAGVILAIMILPTVTAVSREILRAVPNTQREGMLALGATRWETVRKAVLPYARTGIAGAAMLGLARALGETITVTMVIGNSSTRISPSLFTPGLHHGERNRQPVHGGGQGHLLQRTGGGRAGTARSCLDHERAGAAAGVECRSWAGRWSGPCWLKRTRIWYSWRQAGAGAD